MTENAIHRVYFDTNVFVEMVERPKDHAALLLDRIAGGWPWQKYVVVTSELTLAELLVEPIKHAVTTGDYKLHDIYQGLMTTETNVRDIVPISRKVLARAALLRTQLERLGKLKVKLPDAIHLATALEMQCEVIVTNDTRFAKAAVSIGTCGSGEGDPSIRAFQRVVSLDVQSLESLALELGCP